MNCILVDKASLQPGGNITLDERQSKHVIEVLGKSAGDSVVAGILDGPIGESKIVSVDGDLVVIEKPIGEVPEKPPVHIVLAMPRPRVMKRLWSQLASIGVASITIIGAKKVEAYYFASHAVTEGVYRAQLIDGLEQARDTRLPDVNITKSFHWFSKKHLTDYSDFGAKIISHPGTARSIQETIASRTGTKTVIAIGPEGGWTARELALFEEHGFITASLHDRALRTDTAIISLLALTYDALKDRTETV